MASKLLTGKAPRVERAFLLVPKGRQRRLRPVEFGGVVSVDPRKDNIFKAVIEERQRIKRDDQLAESERDQIQLALKIFANAGSYGVFVEMNRKDLPVKEKGKVSLYGRDGGFECRASSPEEPGPYFFAPVAALNTGAARLMLATLERCVRASRSAIKLLSAASSWGRSRLFSFLKLPPCVSHVALASGAHETVTRRVPASMRRRARSTLWP